MRMLKINTQEVIRNILVFYEIEVDDDKIIETINALNPKNNNKIHINYFCNFNNGLIHIECLRLLF